MEFEITFDREEDGRWIAEVESLPGVLAYGVTQLEAQLKVLSLALRVLADQIETAENAPDMERLAVA
jgi:predicted RNase H-like HicB family nuclease